MTDLKAKSLDEHHNARIAEVDQFLELVSGRPNSSTASNDSILSEEHLERSFADIDAEIDRINRYCDETTRAMWSIELGLGTNPSTVATNSSPSDTSNNIQNINMATTSSNRGEEVIDLTATNNNITLGSENVIDLCSPDFHSRLNLPDPYLMNFVPARRRRLIDVKPKKKLESTVVHEVDDDDDTPLKRGRCSPESQPYACPVCLDSVRKRDPVVTKCGHVFCKPCIEEAIKATHKCPMCNKKLTVRQISRIYL